MQVIDRAASGIDALIKLAPQESDAELRDGYLVVVQTRRGVETADIQAMLARSRGIVQSWAYANRDGG